MSKRLIAWHGEEKEGVYKGFSTLFIRGGFEHRMAEAYGLCVDKELKIAQVYFGAGSTKPVMGAVISLLPRLGSMIATVEIESDQAQEIPPDERLTVMLNVTVPRLENVFLKKRTHDSLAVGVRYEFTAFDDVDGMYKDDVPLLWEEIND